MPTTFRSDPRSIVVDLGRDAVVQKSNLADPAMVECLISEIADRGVEADLLVRAAEVGDRDPIMQSTTGLRPALRSRGGCELARLSGELRKPSATNVVYGASEPGLDVPMRTLARAPGTDGIRVNSLVLGAINTPSLRYFVPLPGVPANLVGQARTTDEVVNTVGNAVDNTFESGAALAVDGGASVGVFGDPEDA